MNPGADPTLEELLATCASEPIHIPEAVQAHGALLAVTAAGTIAVASANVADWFGAAGVLLCPVTEVLGAEPPPIGGRIRLEGRRGPVEVHNLGPAAAGEHELVVLGLEQATAAPPEVDVLAPALTALGADDDVIALLDRAAVAIRGLLGFDRVMAYRFDREWNGEVVAEAVDPTLEPFLGLRYPASDIPPQARALYARTPVRTIPDAGGPTAPLLHASPTTVPLDLSDAEVRAVSPVHLHYLRNMGVRASMSLSIVVEGELWGLFACHHVSDAHRPDPAWRRAAAALVGVASSRLEVLLRAEQAEQRAGSVEPVAAVRARAERGEHPAAEVASLPELLSMWRACGVTVRLDGEVASAGVGAGDELAALVAGRMLADPTTVVAASDQRAELDALGAAHPVLAGALAVRVGDDDWVVWWRPELVREVRWGGDPEGKEIESRADGSLALGPRQSFAAYVQHVTGRSREWDDHDVWLADQVRRHLGAALTGRGRARSAVASAVRRVLDDPTVPDVDLDVAVRTRAAAGDPAGGDWHDVVALPHGGTAVSIGDVAGHGLATAATMSHLRHALRAYLVADGDPALALGQLDELVRHLVPGEMATAVICVVAPDGSTVTVVSAGHLPPIRVGRSGASMVEAPREPAIGLRRSSPLRSTTFAVEPDDVIVLFTDGLVERRDEPLDVSLERFRAALDVAAGARPEELLTAVADPLVAVADDDATVVAFVPASAARR